MLTANDARNMAHGVVLDGIDAWIDAINAKIKRYVKLGIDEFSSNIETLLAGPNYGTDIDHLFNDTLDSAYAKVRRDNNASDLELYELKNAILHSIRAYYIKLGYDVTLNSNFSFRISWHYNY